MPRASARSWRRPRRWRSRRRTEANGPGAKAPSWRTLGGSYGRAFGSSRVAAVARNGRHDRADLKRIARRAMVEKGLEPDFSRDALAELSAIRGPAAVAKASGPRDLRSKPWV